MAGMPFTPCSGTECDTETSIVMMRKVFGGVIDSLVNGTDPSAVTANTNVLASMMSYWNSGMLIVASLIFSYVALVGVLNTANDGESMGKQWSSAWTTMRTVLGGAVLLPSASGYSYIQLLVLMFSLWGVGLANTIYRDGAVDGAFSSAAAGVQLEGDTYGLGNFAKSYLKNSYCVHAANSLYAPNANVGVDGVPENVSGNQGTKTSTYNIKDAGVASLAGGKPFCGAVSLDTYVGQPTTDDTTGIKSALESIHTQAQNVKVNVTVSMMQEIDAWVNSMPVSDSAADWSKVNADKLNQIITNANNRTKTGLATAANSAGVRTGFQNYRDYVVKSGWAEAGGWNRRMNSILGEMSQIATQSPGKTTEPSFKDLPDDSKASDLELIYTAATTRLLTSSSEKATSEELQNDFDFLAGVSTTDPNTYNAIFTNLNVWMSKKFSNIITGIVVDDDAAINCINSQGVIGGSLIRLSCLGTEIKAAPRVIYTADASIRLTFATLAVGTSLDITDTTNKSINAVKDLYNSMVSGILSWADDMQDIANYFVVVLPMLGIIFFMAAVVSFFLSVIQSLIAATLWAVMHMTPSRTFIGSQSQGYMLLLTMFTRPALAVVGLVVSLMLADVAIPFVTKMFFSAQSLQVENGIGGTLALFSTIKIRLILYGGVLTAMLYIIFSLPQTLFEQIWAWIGVGIAPLGASYTSVGLGQDGRIFAGGQGKNFGGNSSNSNANDPNSPNLNNPRSQRRPSAAVSEAGQSTISPERGA